MLVFIHAALVCFALICAIGPQNLFIIKEGLRGGYVNTAAGIASCSDAILFALGICLASQLDSASSQFRCISTILAVLFLTGYAATAFWNALRQSPKGWLGVIDAGTSAIGLPRRAVVFTGLTLSFANPHAYLDAFVVLGGMGAAFKGIDRISFWLGATSVSFIWFYGTGHLAARFAPLLNRETSCRMIDAGVGVIMLMTAAQMLLNLAAPGLA